MKHQLLSKEELAEILSETNLNPWAKRLAYTAEVYRRMIEVAVRETGEYCDGLVSDKGWANDCERRAFTDKARWRRQAQAEMERSE